MSSPALPLSEKSRISSIDIARGIIMVIMALDHTRDYFHTDAFAFDATNLEKTNVALFFTRWITHFCAPAFALLSGLSISVSLARKTKRELSRFLITRGLWLIFLEWTLMRFLMFFNLYYDMTILTVLWMLGLCMVCMAVLIYLRELWLLILALIFTVIVNQINLPIPILTGIGFIPVTPSFSFIVSYPLIQWLGVMLVGYLLGRFYKADIEAEKRQRLLRSVGLSFIALFIVFRGVNFGDVALWKSQSTPVFTLLSFLNVSKRPPSIDFILLTVGMIFILLSILERTKSNLLKPFHVFGRVPLFYFLLHFLIIHASALVLFMYTTGKSFAEIDLHFSKSFGGITTEGGISLAGVYLSWIIIVLMLYPICKWYDHYKSTHKHWWLSYL
ncbi:MAG TPA: heparan-alpha-glucosaminide N-acetyltransferase domain-containing protein [Cyclobacteriaceae bacterium]